MSILFGHPDKSFHTKEIIRLANSGQGAVQREIEALYSAGIITLTPQGNQKLYQVNRNNPIFTELQGIILKTFGLTELVREALVQVNADIQIAFVYGSIAKRQDNVTSDVDLMIISDKLSYADLFSVLQNVEARIGRKVNPTFYSPDEWIKKLHAKSNFLMQIMLQPKIFIIGTENELEQLR